MSKETETPSSEKSNNLVAKYDTYPQIKYLPEKPNKWVKYHKALP